jgi:hypothetical protein
LIVDKYQVIHTKLYLLTTELKLSYKQAYDTKQCRQVIADRQAHAVIPPRKNAKPWKDTKTSSLERNE